MPARIGTRRAGHPCNPRPDTQERRPTVFPEQRCSGHRWTGGRFDGLPGMINGPARHAVSPAACGPAPRSGPAICRACWGGFGSLAHRNDGSPRPAGRIRLRPRPVRFSTALQQRCIRGATAGGRAPQDAAVAQPGGHRSGRAPRATGAGAARSRADVGVRARCLLVLGTDPGAKAGGRNGLDAPLLLRDARANGAGAGVGRLFAQAIGVHPGRKG